MRNYILNFSTFHRHNPKERRQPGKNILLTEMMAKSLNSTIYFQSNVTELYENMSQVDQSTGMTDTDDDYAVEITRKIYVVIYPIIIVIGTIGNMMTFIVMQKGLLKRVSSCFYMAILALADTGKNICISKYLAMTF